MSYDKDVGQVFFYNEVLTHQFQTTFPSGTRIRLKYVGGMAYENVNHMIHLSFPSLLKSHYSTSIQDYTDSWEIGELGFGATGGTNATSASTLRPFHSMYSHSVDIDLGELDPTSLLFSVIVNGRRAREDLAQLNGITLIFEIDEERIF